MAVFIINSMFYINVSYPYNITDRPLKNAKCLAGLNSLETLSIAIRTYPYPSPHVWGHFKTITERLHVTVTWYFTRLCTPPKTFPTYFHFAQMPTRRVTCLVGTLTA